MAEISAINNFKKYNSKSGRSSINNVVREAFRELEKFKNNVNQELTKFNKILVKDLSVLERQYYDTEVDSRSRDVVSVVSQVQTGNFEARNGVDLTYMLSLEKWEQYYKENFEFLSKKFDKNARCVYAVIHFDESTPHMQSMWTFSEENNQKDEYTVSDVNPAKVKSALSSAFLRRNKKLGLTAGTDEYKKAFEEFKVQEKPKIIERQLAKLNKNKSDKKFKFENGTSPFTKDFYRTFNEEFVNDFMLNNPVVNELKNKVKVFSNEGVEVVVRRTEKVNSSEDLDRTKFTMEKEKKDLESKIGSNDYSKNEFMKYIEILSKREIIDRKKKISKKDFLNEFKNYETDFKVRKSNKEITDFKRIFNIKKIIRDKLNQRQNNKNFKKNLKKEIKLFDEVFKNVDFEVINKKIEDYSKGEKVEELIKNRENLYFEIKTLETKASNLKSSINFLETEQISKNNEIRNLDEQIREKKIEAEKPYVVSEIRKQELINEALNEARKRGDTLMRNIKKDVEKEEAKNNAIKQDILDKKLQMEREQQELNNRLRQLNDSYADLEEKKRRRKAELEKLAQPVVQKEVDNLVREHLRYYEVTDKDILNFKSNNKFEYDKLFGEAEAKAYEKIKEAYIRRKHDAGNKFIKQMTNILHEDSNGKFSILEIEKTVIAAIENVPDSTYSWWNDFKNNLNIELKKTVKDKNVVRNRSSSQYDRSL
ncbi:plasmid recombination protein [Leptotrichia sp. oral taxon 417]|uniref:plasmid recombination protein n=1 Tax=Leptotrichia sp. oral taxon 417 TaxID=712365 RepID=UPI0015B9C5DD|nr:plasmid recombination protein [Leptotrichia sp. oral taxon 417]NWO28280.1 plasmid recombination protein [Leptotrichia sp. oral taxon 417]